MAQLHADPLCQTAAILGRSTTGQGLAIRYDARSNSVVFVEDTWFAEGLRSNAVPPRNEVRRNLVAGNATRLQARRRIAG